MSRPRSIKGSAGSRIRVILGETGDDYLYYINEDDGNREWQTRNWTVDNGGPPYGLCRQMNNMSRKGRYITKVDYDTTGQWHVAGQKRDGTGAYSWWGATDGGYKIKNAVRTGDGKVFFGNDDGYYGDKEKRWVVLHGRNGYAMSDGINSNLISRMKRINKKRKTINFLRLFNNNEYFISDDEGTHWNVLSHLSKELKNGGGGPVLDVTKGDDGSWLVIRPNRYAASTGVSDELTKRLRQFYREHRDRQANRSNEIKVYDQRKRQQEEERQRRAREAEQRRLKEAREKKEREEAERRQRERELALKRKSDEVDFLRQVHAKRLSLMGRVTAIGFSSSPGDALIRRIIGKESVEVIKPREPQAGTIIMKDLRLLTTYNSVEDSVVLMMLSYASDKFEAAVSLYHCECHNGIWLSLY